MILTEDYCSFEIAKLLKEKGFDGELQCYSYDAVTKENVDIYWQKNINGLLPRCTHQMAMKWLREYPRYIFIGIENQYLFSYEVYHFHIRCKAPKREIDKVGKTDYRTYEEAVEASLKYCLTEIIQ